MKHLPTSILLGSASVLLFSSPAYAYLDPGTGSIIIQGAIAAFVGVLVTGRLYWERLKAFFGKSTPLEPTAEPSEPKEENQDTND